MEQFVLKCNIPPTIYIAKNRFGLGLFSKQNFKKGDVVYENSSVLVHINKIAQTIILETDQGNFELDKYDQPLKSIF